MESGNPSAPAYTDETRIPQYSPSLNSDLPPAYDETLNLPPSYESIYGEFRQVENPKGLVQFIVKASSTVANTVAAAVILALLNIIPIFMTALGFINLHNCPVEHYIPIWLIIAGFSTLLKSATNFYYRVKRQNDGRQLTATDVNINPFEGIISCFLLIWFIIGSVWIYSVYDEVQFTSRTADNYCDHFVYNFSFIFVTVSYCLLALTFCSFCCCCCCIFCRQKGPQQSTTPP